MPATVTVNAASWTGSTVAVTVAVAPSARSVGVTEKVSAGPSRMVTTDAVTVPVAMRVSPGTPGVTPVIETVTVSPASSSESASAENGTAAVPRSPPPPSSW